MAAIGMSCWVAEIKGKIVGTLGYFLDNGATAWAINEEMRAAAISNGVDPDEVQVRGIIYVSPERKGLGIGTDTKRHADRKAYDAGFRYIAGFGFETSEIYRWAMRGEGVIALDIQDPTGAEFGVVLVPIAAP
jgi:GNAT superfamily N-acetyltransferase